MILQIYDKINLLYFLHIQILNLRFSSFKNQLWAPHVFMNQFEYFYFLFIHLFISHAKYVLFFMSIPLTHSSRQSNNGTLHIEPFVQFTRSLIGSKPKLR